MTNLHLHQDTILIRHIFHCHSIGNTPRRHGTLRLLLSMMSTIAYLVNSLNIPIGRLANHRLTLKTHRITFPIRKDPQSYIPIHGIRHLHIGIARSHQVRMIPGMMMIVLCPTEVAYPQQSRTSTRLARERHPPGPRRRRMDSHRDPARTPRSTPTRQSGSTTTTASLNFLIRRRDGRPPLSGNGSVNAHRASSTFVTRSKVHQNDEERDHEKEQVVHRKHKNNLRRNTDGH